MSTFRNRLTFSLASFVFLIALGLVFMPVSVMAHAPSDTTVDSHTHPVIKAINADTNATPPILGVPLHNHHPVVSSIALKSGDNVRGNTVAVDDDASTTSVPDNFTLVVTFDRNVVNTFSEANTNNTANGDLAFGELTAGLLNAKNASVNFVTGDVVISRPTNSQSTFELVVTPQSFPSGTADAADEALRLRIKVDAQSVYSLQITALPDGAVTPATVPGGANLESSLYEFTLVKTLPINNRPTTNISTDEPTASITTGSFTIAYTTADDENDTVTVAVTSAVAPASAATHYTVDDSTAGTVTVTQAMPTATVPIPAAAVTVTITASDPYGAGTAQTISVLFAAATYTAPNNLPTVTTDPATAPTAAQTGNSYSFTYTGADADSGDTVTVGVASAVAPDTAKSHYTVDSTTTAGTVTVTQAMPTAAMPIPAATVTVTLTPNDGTDAGTPVNFAIGFTAKTYTPPPLADGMFNIPAKSYVIVAKTADPMGLPTTAIPANTGQGASATTIKAWTGMPDLDDLFSKGGSLLLTTDKTPKLDRDNNASTAAEEAKERDVLITEIMAAVDEGQVGAAGYDTHQWIELYNNLPIPVTVKLSSKYGRPAPAATATEVKLDLASNQVGGGWVFNLGANGTTVTTNNVTTVSQPFVSFYRKERGKDGHTMGHWTTSTDTYYAGHKGTPGAFQPVGAKVFTKSAVNQSVIFNEVSNSATAGHEWIELMMTGDKKNFENWQVSMITAVGTEDEIFTLPKLDTARFDNILLVTASDPANDPDHPLAAGYDVTKSDADNADLGRDSNIKYIKLDWKKSLPDDGKFVLVLRNGNDKRGTADKVEDIAGYTDANLSKSDATIHTDLWPLIAHGKPNLANNQLNTGVHRRQQTGILGTATTGDGNHIDKTAFRDVGWTGVGYKRNAANIAENGGTPGYPNNAQIDDGMNATDSVKISEIMYSQGSSGRLAQWIELQNTSATQGVNLHNWDLRIVNHSQDATGAAFTGQILENKIRLTGIDIPPNQTALIVSQNGRNTTNLPNHRLKNLRLTKPLLNPNGFYITLVAKANDGNVANHQPGDMAGNLVAFDPKERSDHQSYTDTVWKLPSGMDENGDRVSIARLTSTKRTVATNGTIAGGWITTDIDRRYSRMNSVTYYGHANDLGSPGQTVGSVLPVSLSKFRPERLESGDIVVRWITESELNNAGFNILRSETRDGQFTKLNEQLISGQGTTSERTTYEWKDSTAKPNVVYYYQIQDVSLDGDITTLRQSRLKGHLTPAGKLTTTWGDLKSLQ